MGGGHRWGAATDGVRDSAGEAPPAAPHLDLSEQQSKAFLIETQQNAATVA